MNNQKGSSKFSFWELSLVLWGLKTEDILKSLAIQMRLYHVLQDLQALTLMGSTRENLAPNSLAVLGLNSRIYINHKK